MAAVSQTCRGMSRIRSLSKNREIFFSWKLVGKGTKRGAGSSVDWIEVLALSVSWSGAAATRVDELAGVDLTSPKSRLHRRLG